MSKAIKSSQEVNKVYKTNDLSIFNQIKGNRPPNPQHIRRLADSIKSNGILQNPIIVNKRMDVIDGQHRLLAAKKTFSPIYYIIVDSYDLKEVHILNLNQKNWTKKDFMKGYADMGIESYVKLQAFTERNKDLSITNCIALCSNLANSSSVSIANKYNRGGRTKNQKEVFEEGTWLGRDFNKAQEYADKLKMIKTYYDGWNRTTFVSTMITLLNNKNFDFFDFLHKLKIQPQKLQHCTGSSQYKLLIEDIYNYRRRDKINLRY